LRVIERPGFFGVAADRLFAARLAAAVPFRLRVGFFAEDFLAVGRLAERVFDDAFRTERRDRAAGLALRLAIDMSFRTLTV
jgi:hypothetical protein